MTTTQAQKERRTLKMSGTSTKSERGTLGQLVCKIGYPNYQALYWDWVNSFVSTQGFADYHNIERADADALIDNARYLYSGTKHP